MRFAIGDSVCYQYGQTIFAGIVIAAGYVRMAGREHIVGEGDENLRYIVQQNNTGVLHVYGPRHLSRVRDRITAYDYEDAVAIDPELE